MVAPSGSISMPQMHHPCGVERLHVIEDHSAATLTAAAELSEGVLYVPVSSLEEGAAIAAGYPCCSFRGSIVALDAKSGEELWRRHFIPPAEQHGVNTAGTPQSMRERRG